MRPLLFVVLSACSTGPNVGDAPDWMRAWDTGALPLVPTSDDACPTDPNKTEPGYCGCEWVDIDSNSDTTFDACAHSTATVHPSAVLAPMVEIGPYAHIGAAQLDSGVFVASRAVVEDDAVVGANTVVGRRARVGLGARVGPDSTLGRSSEVGDDVDASVGSLSLGYGSTLGAGSELVGAPVTIGNLVTIGDDALLGSSVVIARGGLIGDRVTLGTGTVLGPDIVLGDDVIIGASVRVRKDTVIGSDSRVGDSTRIGRGGRMAAGTRIGADAVIRANVTVLPNGEVEEGGYIPRNTTVEAIDNCDAQGTYDKVWDGSVSNDWNVAQNWSPEGVPTSSDSVFVCGLVDTQPRLSAGAATGDLAMSLTSTLDTWVRTLSVHGDVQASDIFGAGTVAMRTAASIEGAVPRLDVRADVVLSGDLAVRNNVIIQPGASLSVPDATLAITNGFEQTLAQPDDGLRLTDPRSVVIMGQIARFHGSVDMDPANLDQGSLHIRSSLVVDDTPVALLRVGALTVFDGSTPHSITVPNSSPSASYFTDVLLDGVPTVQPQNAHPLYIAGDLTLRNNAAMNLSQSDVTVAGDLTLEDSSRTNDQLAILQVDGRIDVAPTARLDVSRLAVSSELPTVSGTWDVNQLWVVGDITMTAPYTYDRHFSIRPTGTLTLAGHPLVLENTFQQDIGTNPTAGLHMGPGDTLDLKQGGSFNADVDMATTNFTGGTITTRSHLNTESVPFQTVYMPDTVLVAHPTTSSLVVYMGHGYARFGTIRVPAGVGIATNTSNDAASTVTNLELFGNLSPNADLTVTGTLTVHATGGIGSVSGAVTTVLGSCDVDPTGYIHSNVHCP